MNRLEWPKMVYAAETQNKVTGYRTRHNQLLILISAYLISSNKSHSVWCLRWRRLIWSICVFLSSCVTFTWRADDIIRDEQEQHTHTIPHELIILFPERSQLFSAVSATAAKISLNNGEIPANNLQHWSFAVTRIGLMSRPRKHNATSL